MPRLHVLVALALLHGCSASEEDPCRNTPFGEITEAEMPEGIPEIAAALDSAVGTWVADLDGSEVRLELQTEVDAIEVTLGPRGPCIAKGPATSSVAREGGSVEVAENGGCSFWPDSSRAGCDFENIVGSWDVYVSLDGQLSVPIALSLLGLGESGDWITLDTWSREADTGAE